MKQKYALVLGAAGFIGGHMVRRLKGEGYWVRGVDIRPLEYPTPCDEFVQGDLCDKDFVSRVMWCPQSRVVGDADGFDEVYQFAADMGGAGYVFTGDHDFNIMYNSGQINMNVVYYAVLFKIKKIFYSSSACAYPGTIQDKPNHPGLKEEDAYPGDPDSEYGWEKLYSERLYAAAAKNEGLNVRIARYHNIYGPMGTWKGGKEKAPAAMIRKALQAVRDMDVMEVWGTGKQTRSFLYIEDCIEATRRLMASNHREPINIGSDESVSINDLARIAIALTGYKIEIKNIDGPVGVNGRNSNNDLIRKVLNWDYTYSLQDGMRLTYDWIKTQYAHSL